jgi:bifunctional non-homologous end joining protein LigD
MTAVRAGRRSIDISRADKVFFPKAGITKRDLVEYYRDIAGVMGPHVRGRPVMMHRLPDGIRGKSFYQKDTPDYFPDWIRRVKVQKKEGGSLEQVVGDGAATLAYLADQGCVAFHVWLSRTDSLDHPDRMIFDLDPSGGSFGPVREGARRLRDILRSVGLEPFVMTTGSRGLHVTVPLRRGPDFDTVRHFAEETARLLAGRDPRRFTVEVRKTARRGRLFIDTNRNGYAQTAVAPYSVRAKTGAPVATPLRWDELSDSRTGPRRWTLKNIFRRLGRTGDPWRGMSRHARSLTAARRRLDALIEKEKKRKPA